MDASFPSVALILGFSRSLVFVLVARKAAVTAGIFRLKEPEVVGKLFKGKLLPEEVVVPEAAPAVTAVPCGGVIPNVRAVFRSISRSVASTRTSGFALSKSPMIFSAMATRSGVSHVEQRTQRGDCFGQ